MGCIPETDVSFAHPRGLLSSLAFRLDWALRVPQGSGRAGAEGDEQRSSPDTAASGSSSGECVAGRAPANSNAV